MKRLPGFSEFHFSYNDIQHPVYVAGNGPAILIMHELPQSNRSFRNLLKVRPKMKRKNSKRWTAFSIRIPGLSLQVRTSGSLLVFLLICSVACLNEKRPEFYVALPETLAPRDLARHNAMPDYSGKQKGSLFSINADGSNLESVASYIEALPAGPSVDNNGKVHFFSGDWQYSKITCQRQFPYTDRKWPGSPDLQPPVTAPGPPETNTGERLSLWDAPAQKPPELLQFKCDFDSGNGLYWGHVILTFLLKHEAEQDYKLIFYYDFGTKHEDYISFVDLDSDGTMEVWIQANNYGSKELYIEKQDANGIYRRVFQFVTYQGIVGSCYGYDGTIQVRPPSPGKMPDIVLNATPLYDDDGGCYPATNSEAESLAYIRCVKNTIAGSYVFRFLDYGYQGDDSVKNLETQSCDGL